MSEPLALETYPVGEVPPEVFSGLLTGVLNHEAKLLVAGIMLQNPDTWFTRKTLIDEVRDRQGSDPAWLPDKGVPFNYCINSLEPIGLLVKGYVSGAMGETTAFKVNDENPHITELGSRAVGAILDWSLLPENSHVSVQPTLGSTAKHGEIRTPEIRYNILKTLAYADRPLSFTQLWETIGRTHINRHTLTSNVHDLGVLGLLDVDVLDAATDIVLEIVDPINKRRSEKGVLPETLVFTDAVQRMFAAGKRFVMLADVIEAMHEIDPDIPGETIRRQWNFATSATTFNLPGMKIAGREFDDGTYSRASLSADSADSTVDLISRLEAIEMGLPSTAEFKKRGGEIINTRSLFRQIMEKASQFSSSKRGQEAGKAKSYDTLLDVIGDLGTSTIQDISQELHRRGFPLSEGATQAYLKKLFDSGKLDKTKVQSDPTKKRTHIAYSLPSLKD